MQNDFCSEGGICYRQHDSVKFVTESILPELFKHGIKTSEILSDYRQPRLLDNYELCIPGTWGYNSIIDKKYIYGTPWVKAHNSPVWVRENNSIVQNPWKFNNWLEKQSINQETSAYIFGISIDCCILCVAQELYFRGIQPYIILEGVDVYSGDSNQKKLFLQTYFWKNWMKIIKWSKVKEVL